MGVNGLTKIDILLIERKWIDFNYIDQTDSRTLFSELDSAHLSGVGVIGCISCLFEDRGGGGGAGGAPLWLLLLLRREELLKWQKKVFFVEEVCCGGLEMLIVSHTLEIYWTKTCCLLSIRMFSGFDLHWHGHFRRLAVICVHSDWAKF